MKVSTSSWHYRLATKLGEPAPSNLCIYFWRVILSLPLALGGSPFRVLLIVVAICALLMISIGKFFFWAKWVMATLVIAVVALVLFNGFRRTLIGEYVAARKARICPLIEFEDDGS